MVARAFHARFKYNSLYESNSGSNESLMNRASSDSPNIKHKLTSKLQEINIIPNHDVQHLPHDTHQLLYLVPGYLISLQPHRSITYFSLHSCWHSGMV